jgi:hypothetical protein
MGGDPGVGVRNGEGLESLVDRWFVICANDGDDACELLFETACRVCESLSRGQAAIVYSLGVPGGAHQEGAK